MTTNKPIRAEIEAILFNTLGVKSYDIGNFWIEGIDQATDQIIQLTKDDVIGEDEPDTEDFDARTNTTIFWSHEDSNKLRATQRAKLEEQR